MDYPGEKLLIKLWETVTEKGIASLLRPWQITREGKAHSEARRHDMLMLAQTERDIADLQAGRKSLTTNGKLLQLSTLENQPVPDNSAENQRIEPAMSFPVACEKAILMTTAQSLRTEVNATKAILFAEEQLANDNQIPSEHQVEDDWIFAWRDYAGRVSAEYMQRLWGSVLAGEIKSPGTFSIRTLEFLKTISRNEAELISKAAPYVVTNMIVRNLPHQYLNEHGLNFGALLRLQQLGIISGVEAIGIQRKLPSYDQNSFIYPLVSHRKALIARHPDQNQELTIEIYPLTEIGTQILSLGSFEADPEYLRAVGKQIAAKGFSVSLADWIFVSDTEGRYSNEEKIEAN